MAKKIVILEKQGGGFTSFKYLLWCDVPVGRQTFYANDSAGSVYRDASAGELSMIRSGSISEIVDVITVNPGATVALVQSALTIRFNNAQAQVTSDNPWVRYGTFWDGSSWTNGGAT